MCFAYKFPVFLFLNNVAASLYWFCLGFEACKYKDRLEKTSSVNINYGMIFLSGCAVLLTIRGGKQLGLQSPTRNCCDAFDACSL